MKLALNLAILAVPTMAFTPSPIIGRISNNNNNRAVSNKWELRDLISADELDAEPVDDGVGGMVELTQESAIKIKGKVQHKPGKAEAKPDELLRYTQMTAVEEAQAKDVLAKTGSRIICTGQGVELYKDPKDTLEKIVFLAPLEAIKDAFSGAAPAIECNALVFNFLGGDDLMMGEVLDATNELVVMLDINTKAKITFNSLCHKSVPDGTCAVTVVCLGNEQEEGSSFSGAEKSIAAGEVYVRDGKWWTVDEADINTAFA